MAGLVNADVRHYFDALPESRQRQLHALHALILECFPSAAVTMKYRMPTYSYADGWVAIANQKRYVSLYTCSAHHLADFKRKHPHYKTGKACINFRANDVIPSADVRAVIAHAMLQPKNAHE